MLISFFKDDVVSAYETGVSETMREYREKTSRQKYGNDDSPYIKVKGAAWVSSYFDGTLTVCTDHVPQGH